MKLIWAIPLLLLGPFGVGTACADSDGYYCIGRGYLAYQFGVAAPPLGPHHLNIIRIDTATGFEAPVVFDLPQFQVHGILCGEGSIRIAAYDAIYTVQLDERNRPVRYDSIPWTDRGHNPPEFVGHSLNLGAWNQVSTTLKTDRLLLGLAEDGGQFLLEVSGKAIESEACGSMVTSRVIKTDRNGREVEQLEIFHGRGIRECGGVS
jgi:hypothetical protein